MTNLLWLVAALAFAGVVIGIYLWRERRPTRLEDGIEAFHRELQALSPDKKPRGGPPPGGGRPG